MASVVLVESYYGGSHRAWADSWVTNSRHTIDLITHPDEFWRWRLRGGAVTLAEAFEAHIAENGQPDVVVVSGMLDVAAFVGLARRSLGDTPVALYMHESQLLYPTAPNQKSETSLSLTNWRSMVAADQVWFNSQFHRHALRQALPGLLDAQPSPGHQAFVDTAFEGSQVLYPGVEAAALAAAERDSSPRVPRVLWNQRWDHDKDPRAVFAALAAMAEDGLEFTIALAGERARDDAAEFVWVRERLGDRIEDVGFLPRREYRELLLKSDVVVSAATHEFFGIAIVEAVAAGAVPVLPDRLSFPELVGDWSEASIYPDGELRNRLSAVLGDLGRAQLAVAGLRESMGRFDAVASGAAHDAAVDSLLAY